MSGMILIAVNQDIYLIVKKNKEHVNVHQMDRVDANFMLDIWKVQAILDLWSLIRYSSEISGTMDMILLIMFLAVYLERLIYSIVNLLMEFLD
jgi:hypothetical protein